MAVKVCGTGSYAPSYVMDNNDIAKLVETSDEWIRERTGVARRHIANGDTAVSMACEAGRRAILDAGMEALEVDLILVSTVSSNVILPCTACEVQKGLGAGQATCFDVSGACSGFVLAYNTAAAYLEAGIYKTALVIGSECLSNLVSWDDRNTCILFGDGAGAAVLRADSGKPYLPVTHSDGGKGDAFTLKSPYGSSGIAENLYGAGSGNMIPASQMIGQRGEEAKAGEDFEGLCVEEPKNGKYRMKMDGRAIFQFAVRKVPEAVREVLEKNRIEQKEIDWFILHQANKRILESVAKRLKEPIEKFPSNIGEYGNTSSASIPILLDEMNRKGMLKPGQKIVMAGFGAGLIWAASILEWK